MNNEIRQEQERLNEVIDTITKQISKIEGETSKRKKKLLISVNTFGMTSRLISILSMITSRRS